MLVSFLISLFTVVELNCENLFDCQHDTLKEDQEFLPSSTHHWTHTRYWRKVNHIGQELIALGELPVKEANDGQENDGHLPDLVLLCEVENDSVMRDLTQRSLLRRARYQYLMTNSPDLRGIDVALMYNPFAFHPLSWHSLRIAPPDKHFRPTRDILYVCGIVLGQIGTTPQQNEALQDTLHVLVVHAPSRSGGEAFSRPYRLAVEQRLENCIDSIRQQQPEAMILIGGDFNDYSSSPALIKLSWHDMTEVSRDATGSHGARGTYRYQGEWGSLDHFFLSPSLAARSHACIIGDLPWLMEEEKKYGSVKPFRTYYGPRYQPGYSDHLPLVLWFP
ncbi:endonuclease/exonuclease/phosphatase family protein [Prevotella sp. AGR2160]|uniref:endonuclease/exonuclease/phosphatase family protein n=1 Tax=Prevotella sp. AGR2160 TaxID=1280674 RepID=UPI0004053388|nr:endonuclease/exonuclease/phosphatase family protein [Prevotella sp. AGR2160]